VGTFLILKTDQYFISARFGTKDLPDYNAAYSVVSNLHVFAVSLASGSAVFVSHLWQSGDMGGVHALVKRTARMGMILMVCGVACIAVAGQPLIELWLPKGSFIGYPVLWIFCLMLTLETHHVIVAFCSRATEDEAFAISALVSGGLNLVFTFIFIRIWGLLGVAMGTLVAQMVTNNWYAVYRGLRRLKMSIWEHLTGVVLPATGILLLAIAAGYGVKWLTLRYAGDLLTRIHLTHAGAWVQLPTGQKVIELGGTMVGTGVVLMFMMWFHGLSAAQRMQIRFRMRTMVRRT